MPETDAQDRYLLGKPSDRVDTDPRVFRPTWTGRDDDAVGSLFQDGREFDIVPDHFGMCVKRFKSLNEIKGERVKVVDNQEHRCSTLLCLLNATVVERFERGFPDSRVPVDLWKEVIDDFDRRLVFF